MFYQKPTPGKGWPDITIDLGPGLDALGGGIIGGLVGLVSCAFAGADKILQIEGKSDLEIRNIQDKLRKKARVTSFQ